MMARHNLRSSCVGITLALFAGSAASANDPPLAGGGLGQLLELVSSPAFPSLSGLIQPEEMGMLTDNQNNLSDNEMELELLSNNDVDILSNIQIFSGISITVTIKSRGRETPDLKPKKADRQGNSDKSQHRAKRRKSRRR